MFLKPFFWSRRGEDPYSALGFYFTFCVVDGSTHVAAPTWRHPRSRTHVAAPTCLHFTVPKVIDFPRYDMKCSGENVILRGIFHLVSCFPLHFMLFRGNLDCFSNRVQRCKEVHQGWMTYVQFLCIYVGQVIGGLVSFRKENTGP